MGDTIHGAMFEVGGPFRYYRVALSGAATFELMGQSLQLLEVGRAQRVFHVQNPVRKSLDELYNDLFEFGVILQEFGADRAGKNGVCVCRSSMVTPEQSPPSPTRSMDSSSLRGTVLRSPRAQGLIGWSGRAKILFARVLKNLNLWAAEIGFYA